MPSKAETIRQYTSQGIYVYPVYVTKGTDGKKNVRPIGPWRKDSSKSAADVEAWWGEGGEHSSASVMIDCAKSGIVVIDCDGPEGIANWDALYGLGGSYVVKTPGGGEHHYFREHPRHPIGNDQDGTLAEKVDVRGLGGLVIAPPSEDWRGAYDPDGLILEVAKLDVVPDVVIERMAAKKVPTAPAPAAASPADEFEGITRQFTVPQAKKFVREAWDKLAATTTGYNGAINNYAMACAHFPWLVDQEMCAQMVIKALGPRTKWTEPDENDRATIASAYGATAAGKSWVAEKVEESAPTAAEAARDAAGAPELPSPADPMAVARAIVADATDRSWWRGDFYRHTGAHWAVEPQDHVAGWLYRLTEHATYQHKVKDEWETVGWAPNKNKIANLIDALSRGALQHYGEEDRCIALTNGVLDPASRTLAPHDTARFNLWSLPFAYDPEAGCPLWLAFLENVLPGDIEAQDFLAEWFGYVLSGRTDQQKMAALIGQRRSGKGTVARVLGALVGKENTTGVDLNLISGTFGLQAFVGKALAISGDVRWHSRTIADAIPILLGIIGEDVQTVHRKNRDSWEGHLGVRFMLMSNDTPTFSDRSGALGGRMIYVKFDQSFYGKEDPALTGKLLEELPGILNWALTGLERLRVRGRFTQPESGASEAESVRRLSDPISSFLEDWCQLGPEHSITLDLLYLRYRAWCEEGGRTKDSTTKEVFARDLRSRVPGLVVDRRQVSGKRQQFLTGITAAM